MRKRSLAAPLAALVMLAPGPVAAQAPGAIQASQPERIVAWTGADAGQRRARVPEDALRAFLAERAEADERARRAAARGIEAAMARALRPVLADAEERMAAFVDWVFDWWTAYILLGQTASRAAGTSLVRPASALRAAGMTLDARVSDAYRRLVLQPVATDRRLRGAMIAIGLAGAEALRAECRSALEASRRLVARHARVVEARAADGPWRPLNGGAAALHPVDDACRALVPDPDVAAIDAAPPTAASAFGGGPDGTFLSLRLARPAITVAASTALRMAVPAVGTAVVLGGVAVSGVAAGTGIDYVLNEVDESHHRDAVERDVAARIRAATGTYEAAAAAAHRRALETTLQRIGEALPAER